MKKLDESVDAYLSTTFPLDYSMYFLDKRLSFFNCYRVFFHFFCEDDSIVLDIGTFIKPYVYMFILQDSSDNHCQYTFVTKRRTSDFHKVLQRVLSTIQYKHKGCSIFYEF